MGGHFDAFRRSWGWPCQPVALSGVPKVYDYIDFTTSWSEWVNFTTAVADYCDLPATIRDGENFVEG